MHLTVLTSFLLYYFIVLNRYWSIDLNLVLTIPIVFIFPIIDYTKKTFRLFIPLILFLALTCFFPFRLLNFLTWALGLLLFIEASYGRIHFLIIIIAFILSPIYLFLDNYVGFPIRLELSKTVGLLLNLSGEPTLVSGNLIQMGDETFSVDPACSGLKMLETSFLFSLMILAIQCQDKRFPKLKLLLFITITFILNIISNLIRIILLIKFKIYPNQSMHGAIGVICFIVYVIFPTTIIGYLWFKRERPLTIIKPFRNDEQRNIEPQKPLFWILQIGTLVIISISSLKMNQVKKVDVNAPYLINETCNKSIPSMGVEKYQNCSTLVYLKALNPLNAEHHPMICWKGSGYTFQAIQKSLIEGHFVFTGLITKGKEKIYTAWWYENGTIVTLDQIAWRWHVMKGEPNFCLINVNANSQEDLIKEAKKILKERKI